MLKNNSYMFNICLICVIYEEKVVQVRFKFVDFDEIYIKSLTQSQFEKLKESSIIELCEIIQTD